MEIPAAKQRRSLASGHGVGRAGRARVPRHPDRGIPAPVLRGSSRLLALALAGGGVLLAGCASGGSGAPANATLSDWRPPAGQSCAVSGTPATLPAPEALVDAPALAPVLHQAFEGAVPSGRVLLSLRQDSTGSWTRVAPIEGSLQEAEQGRVAEAVSPHLTPRLVGSVRLLVEVAPDAPPRLSVGRSESCAPAVSNPDYASRELQRLWQQYRRETNVQVVIEVDERGRTGTVTLQGTTGYPMLDNELRLLAGRMTFHPALVDRIPLTTHVQVPLIIRPRP